MLNRVGDRERLMDRGCAPWGRRASDLGGATLWMRHGYGFLTKNRRHRCRALLPEADQHVIHSVLQPRVGLVQFAGSFGSKLAKLIPVVHMSEGAKNQFRTHDVYISLLLTNPSSLSYRLLLAKNPPNQMLALCSEKRP